MGNFFGLIWAAEESSSEDVFVPGLRNLGNNCFLNVILQALASCVNFRIFLKSNIERMGSSLAENLCEGFPLLLSLTTILEDLCTLQDRRIILSPLKVMSAMHSYISHFDLTTQQDAAESFLHLLSCLREELSESYASKNSSLTAIAGPSGRVVSYKREEYTSEPIRWRKQFIGPFDGIICSCLSCRTCGTQIIMDSQLFHTLPLSPMRAADASIVDECTIEDCLNRFMAAERVENYHCSHCWHDRGIKYLSMVEGHEKEIEKLSRCIEPDSCDCRNMSCLQVLPWSNRFSLAFKQLSIGCYPKILCLHLQRTLVTGLGQLVKLQGHISFPLSLNISQFVKDEAHSQHREEHIQRHQAMQQIWPGSPHLNHIDLFQYGGIKLNMEETEFTKENIGPAQMSKEILKSTVAKDADSCGHNIQSPNKVECRSHFTDGPVMYHLVSVVEHFGTAGSGHYTVYRGVMAAAADDGQNNDPILRWFSISDTEVNPASEEEVLAADATLLFYERGD